MTLTTSERRLFGTDGIRGVANQHPMTVESALASVATRIARLLDCSVS